MVLPSVYDAFGVVVNEAMLCGCPVVASDHVGAARDLIADGQTGFVYPCGDVDALAGVLRRALSDRGKLSKLAQAARVRMETWSPRENIEATLEAVARGVARVGRSLTLESSASPANVVAAPAPPASHKLSE
jgi:glycosyltransferase involved in cell wall biosynthesis